MIRNWKETPGKLALILGMSASVAIAIWLHDAFLAESDDRLKTIFIFIAALTTTYVHTLIYKRETLRSLRDELFSLGIVAAGFGAGIWISFAYLDGDSFLGSLPIIVGIFVAWGVDSLISKRSGKA